MRIINVSQTKDREAWLELRKEKITGSRAKFVKPLSRGADRTPEGFWQMIADRIAVGKDGESEMERGHRLEEEALLHTQHAFKLKNLDTDPGMWVSDLDTDIAVSPDAAEKGAKPTYAVEAKCFDTKNHIKYVLLDRRAKKSEDYRAFNQLPKDYQHQVVQYFVVNEHLKTLYFALYDDRIALEHLVHYVIVINRSDIEQEIQEQTQMEVDVLKDLRETIKELKNE